MKPAQTVGAHAPRPLTDTEELRVHQSLAERYASMAIEGHEPHSADITLRVLDLAIATLALTALSPLIVLISLSVLVTSGTPVLYRGRRVGRAGRIYTMLKFRTLKLGAEKRIGQYYGEQLTEQTALEATRLGNLLRFLHLDEIPQLWNVLRGEMSIVGPRPIRPAFFEQLCEEIPQYWQRLVVEPGITGFAQLRMTRETSWAEKLAHDLEYVADRSVRLYVRACAATAWRIVTLPARKLRRALRGQQ